VYEPGITVDVYRHCLY